MIFKKGYIPWNKGIPCSEETKKKIRERAKINPNFGMRGKHCSEEHKRNISESLKGKKLSEEHIRRLRESHKGKYPSKETRMKIRENAKINPNYGMKGKQHSKETIERLKLINIGKHLSPRTEFKKGHKDYRKDTKLKDVYGVKKAREIGRKISESHKGKKWPHLKRFHFKKGRIPWNKGLTKETDEGMAIISKKTKKRWQNPESAKRMIKALQKKPTKLELEIGNLLNIMVPNQYKYNGNKGDIIIGGRCPDFVNCNGQKKVILINGIYWHLWKLRRDKNNPNLTKEDIEAEERKPYEGFGFKVLFLWEDDINTKRGEVVQKIEGFVGIGR